ncbi:MAG: NAD(P)-dependent oxidoreductase [Chloroflexota bacterium]|nr:NAD(P)-dependent oxidoreductase [Chloroflexota bacterium]
MENVAVLGLGIMGGGIAANLIKQGYNVTVWNRTREKAERFDGQAQIADTPRAAATNADIVIACVGDDDASRATWTGEDGALAGMKSGAVAIETSTLTPDWVRELAGLVAVRGGAFLDAPMTGSREAAATGQIVLLIGGAEDVIARVERPLNAISRRAVRIGDVGAGATWKLINNMMGAIHVACLAQGLTLAEAAGLDAAAIAPLITDGPVGSRIVSMKVGRMIERRYDETDFSLKWMHKDARYAIELAAAFDTDVSLARAALALMDAARAKGLDDMDMAAMVEALRD